MKYLISDLSRYTLNQLQDLAEKFNLSNRGTKEELQERIRQKYEEISSRADELHQQIEEERKRTGRECKHSIDPFLQENVNEFPDDQIVFLDTDKPGQKLCFVKQKDSLVALKNMGADPLTKVKLTKRQKAQLQEALERKDYRDDIYPWNEDTLDDLFIKQADVKDREREGIYDFVSLVRKMAEAYPQPTPLVNNWLKIYGQ